MCYGFNQIYSLPDSSLSITSIATTKTTLVKGMLLFMKPNNLSKNACEAPGEHSSTAIWDNIIGILEWMTLVYCATDAFIRTR